MSQIPFLTPGNQQQYLVSNNMIQDLSLSCEDIAWLKTVNFHFLMGYARHYRNLVDNKHWDGPKKFSDIRSLVETEARFASFLTPWIRSAEWYLRATTVKNFCGQQYHGLNFLNTADWSCDEHVSKKIQLQMLKDIHRHGEPYVTQHFAANANRLGQKVPKWCGDNNRTLWMDLVDGLPIWAVIDSFSIGTLGKFLQNCGCQPEGEAKVNQLVARELGINPRHFNKAVESFGITRNLVFHHQRLWMRPMPKSPGISNELNDQYSKFELKDRFKEAHFIALLNISRLLPESERSRYLGELDTFIERNKLFALGIVQPPILEFTGGK